MVIEFRIINDFNNIDLNFGPKVLWRGFYQDDNSNALRGGAFPPHFEDVNFAKVKRGEIFSGEQIFDLRGFLNRERELLWTNFSHESGSSLFENSRKKMHITVFHKIRINFRLCISPIFLQIINFTSEWTKLFHILVWKFRIRQVQRLFNKCEICIVCWISKLWTTFFTTNASRESCWRWFL